MVKIVDAEASFNYNNISAANVNPEKGVKEKKMYDYLIVGAGLYGATAARQLTDAGKTVLVIDKH